MELLAEAAVAPVRLLEIGAALLLLGVMARLGRRIGLSAVPLFLLAGLFFGEGGVGDLGFSDPFLRTSSEIGAILLLLLLGMEYSAAELATTVRRRPTAALLDIVLNATPGVLAGLLLGWGALGAVALGGVTYISSSGIVAQVMRDLSWRANPESPSVIGLLVVEDLVMAPYLPALTAVATGAGVLAGALSVGAAVVVVGLAVVLSLRPQRWLTRLIDPESGTALLLLVLGAALVVAGVAGAAGVSPVVGAFLLGLLLSGEVNEAARPALRPLRDLFAAVFFLFFGLSTDPTEVPGVLLPAALLAAVTVGTKLALARLVVHDEDPHAWRRAGALLAARGEFSVVIAGVVAVAGGLPDIGALAATYVLLTAITGPVLARVLAGPPAPASATP